MRILKPSPQEQVEIRHLLTLHTGGRNRVSKEDLCTEVFGKFSDTPHRKMRQAVHDINTDLHDDALILTDTDEGGFWRAAKDDLEAAARHYLSEKNRVESLSVKVSCIGKKSERLFGKTEFLEMVEKLKNGDPEETQPALFEGIFLPS